MPRFRCDPHDPSRAGAAARLLFTVGLLAGAAGASAALPPVVDGQALPSLAPMLEHVTPAVVNIASKHARARCAIPTSTIRCSGASSASRTRRASEVQQSLGSGVIVDAAKGYVLTNNHVVEGADDITVTPGRRAHVQGQAGRHRSRHRRRGDPDPGRAA